MLRNSGVYVYILRKSSVTKAKLFFPHWSETFRVLCNQWPYLRSSSSKGIFTLMLTLQRGSTFWQTLSGGVCRSSLENLAISFFFLRTGWCKQSPTSRMFAGDWERREEWDRTRLPGHNQCLSFSWCWEESLNFRLWIDINRLSTED